MKNPMTNPHYEFLLSPLYDAHRLDHRVHVEDLCKSGLTDATVRLQRISDVPPHMINLLLGFSTPRVTSAYLIPFPDPRGGWIDHVRMKIFPPDTSKKGGTTKYLQPKNSGQRIFFPLATLDAVLHSTEPLYLVEGEKKALSVAQLGLPTIGICGIEGWHAAGARDLHRDLDHVALRGRVVNVIPDSDVRTNAAVNRAVQGLAQALGARGAHAKLVLVPATCKGIDDYLAASA